MIFSRLTMNPKVSVIIPTFNRAHFLSAALDSVRAQSESDLECIVVDDGSTDETPALLAKYQAFDHRIHYVRQENSGPSAARNRGLRQSKGRYIQFLDSDDVIHKEKLRTQLAYFEDDDRLALSFCDYRYCAHDDINETASRDNFPSPRLTLSRPLWDIASRWERDLSIPIHCFLFDARVFTERGISFDENLWNHEDWDCWLRIFALDPVVHHVSEVLAVYRLHDHSICVDHAKLRVGFEAAIRKQLTLFQQDPEMQRILHDKLEEVRGRGRERSQSARTESGTVALSRLYRQSVPWPIQKMISSLLRSRQ